MARSRRSPPSASEGSTPEEAPEDQKDIAAQPIRLVDDPVERSVGVTREIGTPSAAAPSVAQYRETTRSVIARWLMGLLTLTVVAILALAGLQMAGIIDTSGDISLRDLGPLVLTPVVTLTGTALGFYYGAQSAEKENGADMPPQRKPGVTRRAFRWIW